MANRKNKSDIKPGDRVESSIGLDIGHTELGRVRSVDGDTAFVDWDQGVSTPAPVDGLTVGGVVKT